MASLKPRAKMLPWKMTVERIATQQCFIVGVQLVSPKTNFI
jgi:hypothetical protein